VILELVINADQRSKGDGVIIVTSSKAPAHSQKKKAIHKHSRRDEVSSEE
jgi:hypothetical protein